MLQKIKNNKKGFTLIELMVVIAIIAILATVVLVSLQSARERAQDTNRTAAVTQIRSLAEVYYSKDLDYSGLASPAPEVSEILSQYCGDNDEVTHPNCMAVGGPYTRLDDLLGFYLDTGNVGYCAEIELMEIATGTAHAFFCVDNDLRAVKNESGSRYCDADSVSCEE